MFEFAFSIGQSSHFSRQWFDTKHQFAISCMYQFGICNNFTLFIISSGYKPQINIFYFFRKKFAVSKNMVRILLELMSIGEINARFTTAEFVITIAIVGILTAIAIPNFMVWRSNSKLIGASHNLRGNLEMAKFRAIPENATVAVLLTFITTDVRSNDYT